MYKNYLIVASKQDKAGINITTQLSQFQTPEKNFKFYLVDNDILHTENLNLEKINNFDFIIFASKHQSVKQEKSLCVHAPGNFRNNNLGGQKGKTCRSSAQFFKKMFEKLNENAEKYHLRDYKVTMEATHHGPLIDKPCIFIEVGSTETEWNDKKAGFVIAQTIKEMIESFEPNPYNENTIAIGGPHYCPIFNKIQLNTNFAISHVIPNYEMPLTEEMIKEVKEKTEEDLDLALLDWNGIPNAEERERITKMLDKLYIRYRRTSDIDKD